MFAMCMRGHLTALVYSQISEGFGGNSAVPKREITKLISETNWRTHYPSNY